jgi:hypothetical protein
LTRLDRESGEALWRIPRGRNILSANSEADRFLAANKKFVYATDTSGRLLVLDRKRGTRLSVLPTTDFRFPVINQLSDRLYLASNDGTVLCLHDRDQLKPIRHQYELELANSPVLKKLETKQTDPGAKEMTLREAVALLRVKYQLHFVIAERAFKAVGEANVQDRKVTIPRIENRPLKEMVEKTLAQADATSNKANRPAGPARGERARIRPSGENRGGSQLRIGTDECWCGAGQEPISPVQGRASPPKGIP